MKSHLVNRHLVEKGQKPSATFVVKGLGLLVAAQEKTAPVVEEITNESLMIRMNALKFGGSEDPDEAGTGFYQ